MMRFKKMQCMTVKSLDEHWVGDVHQQVMPAVLITYVSDYIRVFGPVARRVEGPDEYTRFGMAEVVQLFMQAAGSEKAIIHQAVPDDTQAPAETAVIPEKLAYAAVHSPSARVAFDSHMHRHTPASGL